ncbi:MAG: LLM class flavin-dependent oxidoreductase [Thermomicrobia bacterium]|nr:LLM class flavin-dependent oxidoreductase [Thermomicrobia bacterium]MCA1722825.1 LLM class flavin-dependent oxidoreductase [Thermomicrobia bacterium]
MDASKQPAPLFGIGIHPAVAGFRQERTLAQEADAAGLDFISIQDHPYKGDFLETWTLLAVLGAQTERVRLVPNVANLALRPPALLGKAAATLDLLTNGRVELGLGTGAFWDAIAAYGGPRRTPGEAVTSLAEAIPLMRLLWQPFVPGAKVSFTGQHAQLHDAEPGPAPAHPIPIWVGALGPRLLNVTGRLADGWIISSPRYPAETLAPMHEKIDAGARAAGRDPAAIRRWYNVVGEIVPPGGSATTAARPGVTVGSASDWVAEILRYYREFRMDTFVFRTTVQENASQARRFAEEVVPAVKRAISDEQ